MLLETKQRFLGYPLGAVLLILFGCSSTDVPLGRGTGQDAAAVARGDLQGGEDSWFPRTHDSGRGDERPADLWRTAEHLPGDLRPLDVTASPDSNGNPELQVVIMAGQSNMVGLGYNNQLSPSEAGPVPGAQIFYHSGKHPNTNTGTWLPLKPGFGVNDDRFGPELGVGWRLHQLWGGRPFAIIKIAEGGTALHDEWAASSGAFYGLLISTVKAQMSLLQGTWQPRLAGLVWMQGESDGLDTANASAYQGRLISLISSLRNDLGAPDLPVVAGLISPHPMWPHGELVRAGTTAAALQSQPMELVETADLSRDPADDVHFDTAGSLTLGRRLAEAVAAVHTMTWNHEDDFGANQYFGGWSYRQRIGTTAQPMSYDSATNRWVGTQTSLFIGKGWCHPGTNSETELVWRAPRPGLMTVSVRIKSGDNGGGDGTRVYIDTGATRLWGPTAVPNHTEVDHLIQVFMNKGEELLFKTDAGSAGDSAYDTTVWEVDVNYASF